ncbi:hypothetical protein Dimus_001482 [Dionaea muscipula]
METLDSEVEDDLSDSVKEVADTFEDRKGRFDGPQCSVSPAPSFQLHQDVNLEEEVNGHEELDAPPGFGPHRHVANTDLGWDPISGMRLDTNEDEFFSKMDLEEEVIKALPRAVLLGQVAMEGLQLNETRGGGGKHKMPTPPVIDSNQIPVEVENSARANQEPPTVAKPVGPQILPPSSDHCQIHMGSKTDVPPEPTGGPKTAQNSQFQIVESRETWEQREGKNSGQLTEAEKIQELKLVCKVILKARTTLLSTLPLLLGEDKNENRSRSFARGKTKVTLNGLVKEEIDQNPHVRGRQLTRSKIRSRRNVSESSSRAPWPSPASSGGEADPENCEGIQRDPCREQILTRGKPPEQNIGDMGPTPPLSL